MFNPEFLTTDNQDGQAGNSLIQYLQEQSPDTLQRVAKSASNDIQDIIRHNVQGLLGMLPGEHFEVKVTANRDNLANMLASAMMTGYFLRQMEQRKELEETLFADDQMAIGPEDELNLWKSLRSFDQFDGWIWLIDGLQGYFNYSVNARSTLGWTLSLQPRNRVKCFLLIKSSILAGSGDSMLRKTSSIDVFLKKESMFGDREQ